MFFWTLAHIKEREEEKNENQYQLHITIKNIISLLGVYS